VKKSEIINSFKIKPELFKQYGVNSRMLAGLSRISCATSNGELLYRNIPIEDVASLATENGGGFEKTVYLLLNGKLPGEHEYKEFISDIQKRRILHTDYAPENFNRPYQNMMNGVARCVLSMYDYCDKPESNEIEDVYNQSIALIACFPQMIASVYHGKELRADQNLSTAESLLKMLKGGYTKTEVKALDTALILFAEHDGGNNSTFAARALTSAKTDTFSAIAAAIGSWKGTRHGGAANCSAEMMRGIKNNVKDWTSETEIKNYLTKILNKTAGDNSGLLYGFGHAVYTKSDPRTAILHNTAKTLANEKYRNWEMMLYETVEKVALQVFPEIKGNGKPIFANADFYAGALYEFLGLDEKLVTPISTAGRIAGWCAHRIDEIVNEGRIIRPTYISPGRESEKCFF
jgi:citrate synthase